MSQPEPVAPPLSVAGEAARTPAPRAAGVGRAPRPSHIPSLDGIRAASFSIVFLAHAGLGSIVPGYFGLTLFFFLSGYLITTLLRIEFDRTGTISLKHFYLRRVLRIFPPFYLVLAGASALSLAGVLGGELETRAVLAQVLHFTNYYIIRHGWWEGMAPGTWVYWSLAVEEHFYLVFPLFYAWLRTRAPSGERQALVLFAICALVLAWRCVLVFLFHVIKERTYVATDTRVDAILTGCILAVWNNPSLDGKAIDDRSLKRIWLPLGVTAVVVSLVVREPRFEQTLRYSLQSFGLIPFFIAAVRWHDRGIFRLLNVRPVRYVGVLSYSLYLMHTSALYGMEQRTSWSALPRGAATLAGLILIAALLQKYIEEPCAKIRQRLAGYLRA